MSQITYVLRGSLLALCVLVSFGLSAQRTVSGTVTDVETGEALIGANILAKGTSAGTTTDIDGSYSLEVPDDATTLVVSYIGYVTQEVEIGASNVVDVSLQSGSVLDEVVVVGYGTVKKRDATGAGATRKAEDFNVGVINSPEQLIQGRAPGVQITSSSGEPGAGVNIRIRGTSSVRSNNNPLFVVDGVPLNSGSISAGGSDSGAGVSSARNPLNFINPADIESIDILKDASATAIYGSRGANGV
ncbi:MAG: carboxypeptidase-like regulatory domain-containing protein, partial [Saprospiraceae bacterium]